MSTTWHSWNATWCQDKDYLIIWWDQLFHIFSVCRHRLSALTSSRRDFNVGKCIMAFLKISRISIRLRNKYKIKIARNDALPHSLWSDQRVPRQCSVTPHSMVAWWNTTVSSDKLWRACATYQSVLALYSSRWYPTSVSKVYVVNSGAHK